MSAKPTQPLRTVQDPPGQWGVVRELETIHKTLNERLVAATQSDLDTDYAAGDLGTAAEIAAALNATNTRINAILDKIRLSS